MNKVLFVIKDNEQKSVLEYRELQLTDNITADILTDYPVIEQIEGKYGEYTLDDNGNVIVVYNDIAKTEIDILKDENEILQERICELQESLAMIITGGMGSEQDEPLDVTIEQVNMGMGE